MNSIVLACDDKYARYTYITMKTLINNIKDVDEYEIYVLATDDLTKQNEDLLMSTSKTNVRIRIYRVNEQFGDECLANHLSGATYNRMLAIDIVENDVCLYLDSDIIVTADIHELFEYDIEDKYLLGVKSVNYHINESWNKHVKEVMNLSDEDSYINAGVLMMNLKKMREDSLKDQIREVSKLPHLDADQYVLNYCCSGNIGYLPLKYNTYSPYYNQIDIIEKIYGYDEVYEVYEKPTIIHYLLSKPWENMSLPLAQYWWEAAKSTEFYDELCKEYVEFQLSPKFPEHKRAANVDQFFGYLRGQSVIVFGAGNVAKDFIRKTKLRGITPLGVAVTTPSANGNTCEGIPVKTLDCFEKYKNNALVVIATSKIYQDEIVELVEKFGFRYWKLYESWLWD